MKTKNKPATRFLPDEPQASRAELVGAGAVEYPNPVLGHQVLAMLTDAARVQLGRNLRRRISNVEL